jgi:uncharacterized membrane-anchored protein
MTNLSLFFSLTIISLPGIFSTIPLIKSIYKQLLTKTHQKKLPTQKIFIAASVFQSFMLVMIFIACGVLLAPKVNLHAPIIVSIISNGNTLVILSHIFLPTILTSLFGAAVFFALYYFVFKPRLDKATFIKMEELRKSGGMTTRVLYGGIVEEICIR